MQSVQGSPASTTRSHRSRLEPRGPPAFGPSHYLQKPEQTQQPQPPPQQQQEKLKDNKAVPSIRKHRLNSRVLLLLSFAFVIFVLCMGLWFKNTDTTLSPVSVSSELGVAKTASIPLRPFVWFSTSLYSAMGGIMNVWKNTMGQWIRSPSPSLWWSHTKHMVGFILESMQYVLRMLWYFTTVSVRRVYLFLRVYILQYSQHGLQWCFTFGRGIASRVFHFSIGGIQYCSFLVSGFNKAWSLLLEGSANVTATVKSWVYTASVTFFSHNENAVRGTSSASSSDTTTTTTTSTNTNTSVDIGKQSRMMSISSRQSHSTSTPSESTEPWSSARDALEKEQKKRAQKLGKKSRLWHWFRKDSSPSFISKKEKRNTKTVKGITNDNDNGNCSNSSTGNRRSFFLLLQTFLSHFFSPNTSQHPVESVKHGNDDKVVGDQNKSLQPQLHANITTKKTTSLPKYYYIRFTDESCIKLYKEGGRAEAHLVHNYFLEDLTYLLRLHSWTTVYNFRVYCVGNIFNAHFNLLTLSGDIWTQEKIDAIVKDYNFPLLRAACRNKREEMNPAVNEVKRVPEPVQIHEGEEDEEAPKEKQYQEEEQINKVTHVALPIRIVENDQDEESPKEKQNHQELQIEESTHVPEPLEIVKSDQDEESPKEKQKSSEDDAHTKETLEDNNDEKEQLPEHQRQREKQQDGFVCDDRLRIAALEHESNHVSIVKRLLLLSESELTAEAHELYTHRSDILEMIEATSNASLNTTNASEKISKGVLLLICLLLLILVAVVCFAAMAYCYYSAKPACCNRRECEKDLLTVVETITPEMMRWNSARDLLLLDTLDARCSVFFSAASTSISYFGALSAARSATLRWQPKCLANVVNAYFHTCEMYYVDLLRAITSRECIEEELYVKDTLHMYTIHKLKQEQELQKLLLQEEEERATLKFNETEEVSNVWKHMVVVLQLQLQQHYYQQQKEEKEKEERSITEGREEVTSDVKMVTSPTEDAVMERSMKNRTNNNDEESSNSSMNANNGTDLEQLLRDMLLKENREKHELMLELQLLRHQVQHLQERGIVKAGTLSTSRAASLPIIPMDYGKFTMDSDYSDEAQGKGVCLTRATDREGECKLLVSPTLTSITPKTKILGTTISPEEKCLTGTDISGLVPCTSEGYNRLLLSPQQPQPSEEKIECVSPSHHSLYPSVEAEEVHVGDDDNAEKHFRHVHVALVESPLVHPLITTTSSTMQDEESNLTVSRELARPSGSNPPSVVKLTYPVSTCTTASSESTVSTENTLNEAQTAEEGRRGEVVGVIATPSITATTTTTRNSLSANPVNAVTMCRRNHDTRRYHGNDWSDLQEGGNN